MANTGKSKQAWYSGEEFEFLTRFVQAFRADANLRGWVFSDGELLDAYKKLFKDEITSVIVADPKGSWN